MSYNEKEADFIKRNIEKMSGEKVKLAMQLLGLKTELEKAASEVDDAKLKNAGKTGGLAEAFTNVHEELSKATEDLSQGVDLPGGQDFEYFQQKVRAIIETLKSL